MSAFTNPVVSTPPLTTKLIFFILSSVPFKFEFIRVNPPPPITASTPVSEVYWLIKFWRYLIFSSFLSDDVAPEGAFEPVICTPFKFKSTVIFPSPIAVWVDFASV